MREFQEKKRLRRILFSKWVIAILGILIIFFAHATWGVYLKEKESAADALQANNELERLVDRQTLLKTEISRLSTSEGIDEEIRQKFGVAQPGEHMIIIVPAASTTASTTPIDESWWQKFKNWFK